MMRKINLFIQFIILLTISLNNCNGKISNKRWCADEKCSTIISTARTTIKYVAGDQYMLSFQPNKLVNVLSKSAGDNLDLWGVEIGGRRGYVPYKLLVEQKIYKKNDELIYEVDTELAAPAAFAKVEPSVAQPPASQDAVPKTESPEVAPVASKAELPEVKPPAATPALPAALSEVVPPTTASDVKAPVAAIREDKPPVASPGVVPSALPSPEIVEVGPPVTLSEVIPSSVESGAEDEYDEDDDDSGAEADDEEELDESEQELNSLSDEQIDREKRDAVDGSRLPTHQESDVANDPYKGKTPVNEPPFIKKEAYVTGETDDAPIQLEIAASNADIILKDSPLAQNITTPVGELPVDDILNQSNNLTPDKKLNSLEMQFTGGVMAAETNAVINGSDIVGPQVTAALEASAETIEATNVVDLNQAKIDEVDASSENIILQKNDTVDESIPVSPFDGSLTGTNSTISAEDPGTTSVAEINEEKTEQITDETVEQADSAAASEILPVPVAAGPTESNANSQSSIEKSEEANDDPTVEQTAAPETVTAAPETYSIPELETNLTETTTPLPKVAESTNAPGNETNAAEQPITELPTPVTLEIEVNEQNLGEEQQPILENEATELNATDVIQSSEESAENVDQVAQHSQEQHVHPAAGHLLPPHVPSIVDLHPHHANGHDGHHHQHHHHQNSHSGEYIASHGHGHLPHGHQHIHEPPPNIYLNPSSLSDRIVDARPDSVETVVEPQVQQDARVDESSKETEPPHDDGENPDKPTPPPSSTAAQVEIDESLFIANPIESHRPPAQGEDSWIDNSVAAVMNFVHLFNPNGVSDDKQRATSGDKHETLEHAAGKGNQYLADIEDGYCEKVTPGSCPKMNAADNERHSNQHTSDSISYDDLLKDFLAQLIEKSDILVYLVVTAITVLLFTLGHYFISNNRKENVLISKLNILEKKLMTSDKECLLLKNELLDTRNKLASIEDNSFGSNDMVIALKKELEINVAKNEELQQQVATLDKELEAATEAGLELNNMISELLNSKNGSDSIISSVEELQRQLNEQEAATMSINNLLAEKSRENSELHIQLANRNGHYETEIEELLKAIDVLKADKESIESQLNDRLLRLEKELRTDLDIKRNELTRLTAEHSDLMALSEDLRAKLRLSEARAQALEESINKLKIGKDGVDFKSIMDATDLKTQVLALSKERESLRDKLDGELDARHLLEDHVKVVNEEMTSLRQGLIQAEKDKIEAQTRLEVLSAYFKEKETQLQKELSVKEAIAMKQQGESTSTVERIKSLQQEIHELKSQNDALRAEVEAQSAAHKAQINAAEARANDFWLSSKQSERRFEEARAEASALRRKLTTYATNNSVGAVENNINSRPNNIDGLVPNDVNAPSPIHLESPSSPIMGLPPPPFLPPFIRPPPMNLPFMPPPPLLPMPPGEMRPAPLGRLMSPPPPPNNRYSPNSFIDDRDRYGSGRYSPDDRYNDYSDMRSQYETETDFSPPRSPEPRPYRDHRSSAGYKAYPPATSPLPPPQSSSATNNRKPSSKGGLSSGSIDSTSSRKSRGGRV